MLPGFPPRAPRALQDCPLNAIPAAVIDFETTGLYPNRGDEVIELAAVHVDGWDVVEPPCFNEMVNPGRPVSKEAFAVHHIPDEALVDKPPIAEVLDGFLACLEGRVIVGHNVAFDLSFLVKALRDAGKPPLEEGVANRVGAASSRPVDPLFFRQAGKPAPRQRSPIATPSDVAVLDTRWLSRLVFPTRQHHSLDAVAKRLHIPRPQDRHRALGDAWMTAQVLVALLKAYETQHPNARLQDLVADCAGLDADQYGSAAVLRELEKGAREHRVVDMVYAQPAGRASSRRVKQTQRRIQIYHLEPPYMVAFCLRRQKVRTFRTDRVISATCLEETFEIPPDFHPQDHFKRW